jgi:signal peptidase I
MNKPDNPAEVSEMAHQAEAAEREQAEREQAEREQAEREQAERVAVGQQTAAALSAIETARQSVKKKDSWLEVVKTIVYALLIAGVIRSFLFQPFNIPSGSMEATLLVGDYLFVSKSTYGFSRYSFPFGFIPFDGRFFVMAEPQRGDIVVFKFPPDNSTDYIKRLIGLPGDRIQMRDGVLYINDQAVPKERIEDYIEDVGGQTREVPRYRETLPNGVSYEILDREPEGNLDNTQVYVVPEGHYFMMGDNRDNSLDSRVDVGYVPFQNFVGKAQIIFFSTNGTARIWEVWKWPFAIRYERVGLFVE